MTNEYKTLIGFQGDIIDLSNELEEIGFEDICNFGNWEEILEYGNVVVKTNISNERIKIDFEVIEMATEDVVIETTEIKIINIEEF